jgi:hypothetical protein
LTEVDTHIRAAIRQLDYDFRHFTLDHFIAHLIQYRQRDIILTAFPFGQGFYGAWLKQETADYVFYNAAAHPVHQVHSILHELGHIVLGHQGVSLEHALPPALLAALNQRRVVGRLRQVGIQHSPEDHEAEVFVRLAQQEIMFANRLEQLTARTSSIDALEQFTRSLGYHD